MASYFRPIIVFTGILTLVQSITWFVLSLLGILAYRCKLSAPVESGFTQLLYHTYFQGPTCPVGLTIPGMPDAHVSDIVYADPYYIHAWMAAYLSFNILYFLISISMFIGFCKSSNGSAYPVSTLRLWCANTLAFLIMDAWLTIVWGIDYGNFNDYVEVHGLKDTFSWAPSVPGALMAITARGFLLYVINLILFFYFMRFTLDWGKLYYCFQTNNSGSQQHLHQASNYPSIPRVDFEPWSDNGKSLVPVSHARPNYGRPSIHVADGVTSFNEWEPQSARNPRNMIWEEERPSRHRAPTPPKPKIREEPLAAGHPHKAHFEFQDRRNFEQGGRPLHQGVKGRTNDAFY